MTGTYSISAVLLSAVAGAVSALIIQAILKSFGLRYGREIQNWNALVKLEHLLNKNLQLANDNGIMLDKIIEKLKKREVPVFHLRVLELDKDVMMWVKNIDLKNDVFCLYIELERMNHFIEVASSLFLDLRKSHLSNQMSQEGFASAIGSLTRDVESMKEYTKFLDNELQVLLAKVRVLNKSKGFMRKVMKFFNRKEFYPTDFSSQIEHELNLLKNEFVTVSERRKQKINKPDKMS